MKRIKITVGLLVALFVVGAVVATAAQAEEAPYWSIEGARLGAGETATFTARSEVGLTETTPFVLKSPGGEKVTCEKQTLASNVRQLIGSAAGNPGTSEEVIELRECKVEGNGTGCTVNEPVKTTALKNELVYDNTKTFLEVLFKPVSGTLFETINFTGANCTFKETKVKGSVDGELWTDPTGGKEEGKSEREKVTKEKGQATSVFIVFPTTAIKKIWLITNGVGSEVNVEGLEAFAEPSILSGTQLLSLPSGSKWSRLR